MTDVSLSDVNGLFDEEAVGAPAAVTVEPVLAPAPTAAPQRSPFASLVNPDRMWGLTVENPEQLSANPRRVAVDLLRLFLANRTPVTLWGPVGARKTRTIEGFTAERDINGVNFQVITLQPST